MTCGLTIAKGNWRSIKRDMAGKMTSEVRGIEDVNAAAAKELNATSTVAIVRQSNQKTLDHVQGIPLQIVVFNAYS